MMKYVILLVSILNGSIAWSQSTAYIALNNQECVSCLGKVHYIKQIDNDLTPSIVFPKRYKFDSAALLKRLHLESISNRILWSDSLYNVSRNDGLVSSSISLYNRESKKILKTGLVQIADNLKFINSINKPSDTITFDKPAFGSEPYFANSGAFFYVFNGVSKEVNVFDKLDNKFLYSLSLTDSMIKEAFKMRFGKEWKVKLDKVNEYTSKWQTVDPQAYSNVFYKNDTAYLLAQHRYMIYPEEGAKDVNTTVFFSLSVFKGNKLIQFSTVNNNLDPMMKGKEGGIRRITNDGKTIKGTQTWYIIPGEFLVHGNDLFFGVLGHMAEGIPNHVFAKFVYDPKTNSYQFSALPNKQLPEAYTTVGYNFQFPGIGIPYSFPYTCMYLSDHLFSLEKSHPDIKLNIFPTGKGNKGKGIWDLKVSDDNIYLVYMNNDGTTNTYNYLKYSIRQNKILVDKTICNFKSPSYITTPSIDDFDYSYIYLPISENSILRKKMAE